MLGDQEALHIYKYLLSKTRSTVLEVAAIRHLYYSEDIPLHDDWPDDFFEKKRQASGDLGRRMEMAFRDAFADGAEKALIVGSDCPELTGSILESAFALLDTRDFVLGPVADGGYYLLGMRTFAPTVFHDIEWSTETVLQRTLERIEALGKSHALLPLLTDIDEAADWARFCARQGVNLGQE